MKFYRFTAPTLRTIKESYSSEDKTKNHTVHPVSPSVEMMIPPTILEMTPLTPSTEQLESSFVVPMTPLIQSSEQIVSDSTYAEMTPLSPSTEMMDSVSPSVEMIPLPTFNEQILSDSTSFVLRHVSPRELRPLPQVSQETPSGPRPKSNNRLGRTRILTDTPEKYLIEEDHKKKEEKENKRKERENKKEEKGKKKTNRELIPEKKKVAKKRKKNEENVDPDCDGEKACQPLVPQTTRTGRLIKKKKITDL